MMKQEIKLRIKSNRARIVTYIILTIGLSSGIFSQNRILNCKEEIGFICPNLLDTNSIICDSCYYGISLESKIVYENLRYYGFTKIKPKSYFKPNNSQIKKFESSFNSWLVKRKNNSNVNFNSYFRQYAGLINNKSDSCLIVSITNFKDKSLRNRNFNTCDNLIFIDDFNANNLFLYNLKSNKVNQIK